LDKTSFNVKFFDWDYLHLTALTKETYFKICSQYLEENLNIWNVIEIMITADKINGSNNECKFLLDACTKFIKNHCGKLSKPQNWDEDVSSCLLFKALSSALFENDA
jgi:hypothetical protein